MIDTGLEVRDALRLLVQQGYRVTNSHGGVVEGCLGGFMHEGCVRRAVVKDNAEDVVDSFLREEAEGLGDTPRGVT